MFNLSLMGERIATHQLRITQHPAFQSSLHNQDHQLKIRWFNYEIIGPQMDGLRRQIQLRITRHDNQHHLRSNGLDPS
jgi:hypothetical protein